MQKNRTFRSLGIVCTTLTTVLFGLTACEGGSSGVDSAPAKTRPTLTPQGTAKGTAAPTSRQSSPSTPASKEASAKPSVEDSQATVEVMVLMAIKRAENENRLIDIAVTHNAACSQSKGETLELSKITGGWEDSPYVVVSGYADAPINLDPGSYTVTPHQAIGNPRSDWSFRCSRLGYHTVRFVEIGVEGEEPQVTEEVGITVSE